MIFIVLLYEVFEETMFFISWCCSGFIVFSWSFWKKNMFCTTGAKVFLFEGAFIFFRSSQVVHTSQEEQKGLKMTRGSCGLHSISDLLGGFDPHRGDSSQTRRSGCKRRLWVKTLVPPWTPNKLFKSLKRIYIRVVPLVLTNAIWPPFNHFINLLKPRVFVQLQLPISTIFGPRCIDTSIGPQRSSWTKQVLGHYLNSAAVPSDMDGNVRNITS